MNQYTNNPVINSVIETINGHIEVIVEKQCKYLVETLGQTLTKYTKEEIRVGLIFNLIKNLHNYVLTTDTLVTVHSSTMNNDGSITVNFTINRQGTEHRIDTDVILVGGYNLVSLHYRFIVKTNLRKETSDTSLGKMKERITNNKKLDTLEKDLVRYQDCIKREELIIETNNATTDEEIALNYHSDLGTKSDGSDWDEKITYNPGFLLAFPTKEGYMKMNEENVERRIASFRDKVRVANMRIKDYKKTISKTEKKISELTLLIG